MSLTTKNHLNIVIQTFKKLLSFKADKSEVATKIDRSEIATDDDIMDVLTEMNYIEPISASDGSIYTNKDGEIYIL